MIAGGTTPRPASISDLISPGLCAKLDRLDVVSRRIFAGRMQGERRSKRRGQSVEFDDHRPYVAGDDLRHIDWNVFARLDRFFIKVFQEEQDLSVHLVVDASASMDAGAPNKLIFSLRLAMALGYLSLVRNNRVSAAVFGGDKLQRMAPGRGRRQVERLARFLLETPFVEPPGGSGMVMRAARPPGPGADFTGALKALAATSSGGGVLIVVSDVLIAEGYDAGLRYLAGMQRGAARGAGFDACCIQVLSPGEIDPAREAGMGPGGLLGDLRLTDAETGRTAEVSVTAEALEKYRRAVKSYVEGVASACRRRDIAHVLAPTDVSIESLLLDDLRRRGFLR